MVKLFVTLLPSHGPCDSLPLSITHFAIPLVYRCLKAIRERIEMPLEFLRNPFPELGLASAG
jgi:hypothetical protein